MKEKKTVIITGGNSGLGFECVRNIAKDPGYRVILACRNMAKAEQAKDALIKETVNPDILTMELDTSSLPMVRAFVSRFQEMDISLYGLVCNAGINGANVGTILGGLDVVFSTNHLGHFLLTNLLLPNMHPSGRIAVVSSDMHCPPGDTLVWPGAKMLARPEGELASSFRRYSFSKLCNIYFTYELSERLMRLGSCITVNALNPGLMTDTNFSKDKSRFSSEFLRYVSDRLGSLKDSGKMLSDMITDPHLIGLTAKYFDRVKGPINSSPLSYSRENALELWNESVALTGMTADETLSGLL